MKTYLRQESITLKFFVQKGEIHIGFEFHCDNNVKTFVKQLPFIQWSKQHRRFYMPGDRSHIRKLIDHCKGRVWVDLTQLRMTNPVEKKKSIKLVGKYRSIIPELTLQKIDEVRKWMEQKRYSEQTVKVYISFIKQFFATHSQLQWNEITVEEIRGYNHTQFIQKKLSFSSQNQWINAIKTYIKVHGLNHFDLQSIERRRKVKTLPNVLSQEEVSCILKCIKNKKQQMLLMMIYACGLRIGEALRLEIHDVRSNEGLIYIRQSKGAKDRRVPLSKSLLKHLRNYYVAFRPKKYLFEGVSGKPYSASSARKVLKRAVKKCGIQRKITLHTLRHSYATHLTNNGVNILYLQEILGHNSPKTTMLYTHLSGKDIKNIKSPFDDLDI